MTERRLPMLDPIVFRELLVIRKIIADETWLEGERRGCGVPANDSVVRDNVCLVVLRVGATLRETLTRDLACAPQELPPDCHPRAA